MPDVIRVKSFGGAIPLLGDRALPDGFAVESRNTYLYGNELRGMRPPANLAAINSITKKVFRLPKRTVGGDPAYPSLTPPSSYLGDSVYMQFTDPDTDIVRGQITQDQYERFYYCSPSTGPMYNTYARLLVGSPGYKLGVNAPTTPLGISISGGVAPVAVSRSYITTWVSQYGEESGPSPPAVAAGLPDGTWHLTSIPQPSAGDILNRATITKINIYRTITANTGVTTYFFVASVNLATTTYDDVLPDTTVAIALSLPSLNYVLPPAGMEGFIAMPNGYMVGWKGSDLYFSEPFQPHAWPVEYIQGVEYPIVGIGVFGTTGVVCTAGFPVTFSGVAPVQVAFTKSQMIEPCLSRGSIVSNVEGVYYASQNGLMAVTAAGMQNVTSQLVTREKWAQNFSPQNIRAVRYQSGYLALLSYPTGGPVNSGFFLDPSSLQVALTEFSEMATTVNIHNDVWSGEILVLDSSQVKQWDPTNSTDLWPVLWRSKEYQLVKPLNLGCYAVYWDETRYANNAIDASLIDPTARVRVRVWAGRVLVYDQITPKNGRPIRLPSGFKSDIWQFEVRARAPVYALHVARTEKELALV